MTQEMAADRQNEIAAKEIGTDPLMERTLIELLKSLPKRIVTMITKLLSMKGVAFMAWFYLVLRSLIGDLPGFMALVWAFFGITIILIFGEKALKYIKEIKG